MLISNSWYLIIASIYATWQPNAASGMAVHDDCKLKFLDLRIDLRESWMVFRWSCKLLILLKWALMLLEAALCELCNGDLSNYWFNVYRSWNLELVLIYDNGLVLFTFRTSWIVTCWLYWVILFSVKLYTTYMLDYGGTYQFQLFAY